MERDEHDVVRVYSGPLVLVEVYKGVLEGAGVACRVVGTELTAGIGSALPEAVELWVQRGDLPRAQELIANEGAAPGRSAANRT